MKNSTNLHIFDHSPIFFIQEFDDYRDADDAVYELNGKVMILQLVLNQT